MLLRFLHIPCSLAVVLCVIGGIRQTDHDPKKISSGKTFSKVGVVIFLLSFVEIAVLALFTLPHARKVPIAQRRILHAVLLALPLLAIILLYSMLANFNVSNALSVVHGNPCVQLGMAIIEEFIVVIVYTAAGVAGLITSHQAGVTNRGFGDGGDYRDQRLPGDTDKGGMRTHAGVGI